MRQCPRCASEITKNDKVCPRCGIPVDKMNLEPDETEELSAKLSAAEKRERKKQIKAEKKAAKKAKKLREQRSDTDFSKFASNSTTTDSQTEDVLKKKNKRGRKDALRFELDDNGEFNIDTTDVEIVGEKTGKIIEERHMQTYSVKKARGDYREPKIKWWEIYKLADRSFARRKIKKEVVKASKIKPDFISKTKLLLLAIFLGWIGAHNFYAKNKRKGWVSVVSFFLWTGVVYLAGKIAFFASIQLSVGGCAGFIVLTIWFGDIINIIFNNFRYRIQAEEFIFGMNIKTRAKLGEKYIDIELYQKPWWVRFKVWCQKKKRGYQEWKHERRQRMIEKEKAKIARQEEQARIDAEIAEFEAKESIKSKEEKIEEVKKSLNDSKVLDDIKTFENEEKVDDDKSSNKPKSSPKKPKVSVTTKNKNKKK